MNSSAKTVCAAGYFYELQRTCRVCTGEKKYRPPIKRPKSAGGSVSHGTHGNWPVAPGIAVINIQDSARLPVKIDANRARVIGRMSVGTPADGGVILY